MKIAIPKETYPGERRVALVPGNVAQLLKVGHQVAIESSAGMAAGFNDDAYREAGAAVVENHLELLAHAEIIAQVRGYASSAEAGAAELAHLRPDQILVGLFDPLGQPERLITIAQRHVTVLALETMPRISRAQSMDVLSSMATVAGYKAVLLAADSLPKMFPLLMTAAGTVAAARVLVLGAGVAGLQAISTARRLGAIVEGYDIRPAAQEQIRSLGAKAVTLALETEQSEDTGGYAKDQSADFVSRQQEQLAQIIAAQDVVITTAAVPGGKSPILITRDAVERMRQGSVIVDLAAERGGNCELTRADEVVAFHGVRIFGPTNLASEVPADASLMYGNNLTTYLKHLTNEGLITFSLEDEITRETMVTRAGEVVHPRVRELLGLTSLESTTGRQTKMDEARASQES